MLYEHRSKQPIPRAAFVARQARHAAAAFALLTLSLGIGMAGYAYFEGLDWRDSFLNAAMILGGMGPVHAPVNPGGKVFAGCYALYSGLVFLIVAALLLAPGVHRLLHHYHWEGKDRKP